MSISGETVEAMTVNGGIPGPTLYYTEGDTARVTVHNEMSTSSSIHWHGVLVPPNMDGVPFISFPPIGPGETYVYEYPIRQNGTYWYHSHTDLQEQRGIYGAIVIEPKLTEIDVNQDVAIVLSDWTNENPHEVLRTLKRGDEWYSIEKGSSQSVFGAMKNKNLNAYINRELQRMPPMDISDVAYDRFLANGKPTLDIPAKAGERIRLRIVDGSSMTFFYLEYAGGPMTIIAADGQRVEPIETHRFLISVAETYDIIVDVPEGGAYELRATAQDASAFTSIWIGDGEKHYASKLPDANLYEAMHAPTLKEILAFTPNQSINMTDQQVKAGDFDQPGMGHMKHDMQQMHHTLQTTPDPATPGTGKAFANKMGLLASDVASRKPLVKDGTMERPWPPYSQLRATHDTAFSAEKPVKEIRLTLDGDMERYVWLINNKPLSASDNIEIKKGEVVRFIMINRTMMHHPMHLHGHFFRVINGQGERSPLKHTVDVAPMSTTVIEFDANEFGDWFFHCHLLYHMKSGMARMVHYEDYTPSPQVQAVRPNLYKNNWYSWGELGFYTHMSDGRVVLSDTYNIYTAYWEIGWQDVPSTETEVKLTYERYINRFISVFGGGDFGNAIAHNRGIAGIHYLLPLNIHTTVFAGTDGSAQISANKEIRLAPRLTLKPSGQYDTETKWEGELQIMLRLNKVLSLSANINSDYGSGAGVELKM